MISRTTLRDNQSWTAHIANPKFARRPRALQARCLVRYASRPVVLSLGFVFRQNDRVSVPPSDRVSGPFAFCACEWAGKGVAQESKGADFGLLPSHFITLLLPVSSSPPRVLPSTAVIPHSTSPLFSISFFFMASRLLLPSVSSDDACSAASARISNCAVEGV